MASFGVMAYLAREEFGTPWAKLVPLRRVSAWLIAPVFVITIGQVLVVFQLTAFCTAVSPLPVPVEPYWHQAVPLPIQYVGISLIPAVFEEAIDRGIVLQVLLATEMSPRRAIALSAFLFAAAHFDLEAFPAHFLAGALLGWMFVRTGSLIPGMLMHAANNAIAESMSHYGPPPPPIGAWLTSDRYGMLPAATAWVGLALTVVGVVAFQRVLARPARALGAGDATSEVLDRAA